MSKEKIFVALLILFSFLVRVWRLDIPDTYYFDEVYHAFTAQAYAQNDPKGYEWWNAAPEGFAFEWLHPPVAKLIQGASIKVLGDTPFVWRFPGVLFSVATGFLLYLFGKNIFKSARIGFLAAYFWAVDGLSFTMSRIAMNDIYLVFWITLALYLFLTKKPLWLTGIFLGLAIATKWSGVFAVAIVGILWVSSNKGDLSIKRIKDAAFSLLVIPAFMYVVSFGQFFLQGHSWAQFLELHRQTWGYQTTLDATHPYSSGALSWLLMTKPIFAYTNLKGGLVSNIYLMGNPVLWWGGLAALIFIFFYLWRSRRKGVLTKDDSYLAIIVLAYLVMFLPWVFSPRIMFIYHYLPALPFLFLLLAWSLNKLWDKNKILVIGHLALAILAFVLFYPHWSGFPVPQELDQLYYVLPSWR